MKSSVHRVLIAGIGNIFHGDDAFGVEAIRHLLARYEVPDEVRVEDFGIRGYDLAYAIGDGYEAIFLVDACPRGAPPGTLYLLELDPGNLATTPDAVDAHSLNPVAVLQLVKMLGTFANTGKLYLVGCEPAVLECEDAVMDLSAPVAAAIPGAVDMIRSHLARHFALRLKPRPAQPGPAVAVAAS